jgi:hypothetical protein
MKILLGRDQTAHLDGELLEGTEDFDLDIEGETIKVTPPHHGLASHLVIGADFTITVVIKWHETYAKFAPKFNQHPPQPMTLAISNVGSLPVVMVGAPIRVPLANLVGWQVKLKPFFLAES